MGLHILATALPSAQNGAATGAGAGMLPLLLIAVAFIGFMMFSNRRRQKKNADQLASLRPGDKVQLSGGMQGTIVSIGTREAFVEVAPGVVVTFVPQAIMGKLPEPSVADLGEIADETDEPEAAERDAAGPDSPTSPDSAPGGADNESR
ncbi:MULTISPECIES: preprotein translocase subunit YajC [unclassified Pseudactinotalea]|uniref:preprotein translocase subunit YajC n=1 Tax=unclassified Pseudactinotalea TaxID=2649176 RepID=UPI00128C1F5E|nr:MULTISPECIES: preprotein translocase subunit YajC [unclassified Pseudactinotalea]MPV49366.1 hypothetical protein [Pseudactinotalea sp. HY160]QGH69341.1 hypothetical protein GCE65_07310 [Pseudactinotalea sp. HY158]